MGKMMLLSGIAAGATAMYFLDPEHGSDRRRRFGDQFRRALDNISDDQGRVAPKDLVERTKDAVSDARGHLQNGYREDLLGGIRETAQEIASTGRWSPRTRLIAGGLGGALVLYGPRRTSMVGLAVMALGSGLVARALSGLGAEQAAEAKAPSFPAPAPRGKSREAASAEQLDATDVRDRGAEEEMTGFIENPQSIS